MNRFAIVSTLSLLVAAACSNDDGPCLTTNAVRTDGVCDCPKGLRTVDDVCVPDPAVPNGSSVGTGIGDLPADAAAKASDAGSAVDHLKPAASVDDGDDSGISNRMDSGDKPAASRDAEMGKASPAESLDAGSVTAPGTIMTGPACVAAVETCDDKDNDCDGQVDEGAKNQCGGCTPLMNLPGASCSAGTDACATAGTYSCRGASETACSAVAKTPTTWYRDCDGDGFASDASGSQSSCGMPAAVTSCKSWTVRMPIAADQDCDDGSALRYPGASFGLTSTSSADRNCDGKVEAQYEFVDANRVTYTASTLPPVCTTNTECSCLVPFAHFKGYRSFDYATGRVDASDSATIFDYVVEPPPCASLTSDVISTAPVFAGPDCRTNASYSGIFVILRKLCR